MEKKQTLRQLAREYLDSMMNEHHTPEQSILRDKINQCLMTPPDQDMMKIIERFIDVPLSRPEEFNKFVEEMEEYIEGLVAIGGRQL